MTPDPADDDGDEDGVGDEDGDSDRNGSPPGTDDGPAAGGSGATDPFDHLPDAGDRDPFESLPAEDTGTDEDRDPFEEMEADPLSAIETDAGGTGEAIVPKDRYCESCEHFAEPPDVRCAHPGTEIRELVDMDHFRVFDCPVVADRQEVSALVARDIEATVGDPDDGADGN